jgi:hypothetical protein
VALAVGLGLAVGALVLVLGGLSQAEPDYWPTIDANAPGAAATAARFEQWLVERFTADYPDGQPWRMELEQRQVNQWLATRARRWAANQQVEIPAPVREVRLVIRPDQLILAGRLGDGSASTVYSVIGRTVRPDGDDLVHVEIDGARAGRLPVPVVWVLDRLAQGDRLKHRYPLALPLGDGRVVEVIDAELAARRTVLTCRTVR